MFSRKKDPAPSAPKKKSGGAALMAQMGMGLDIDSMVYGDLDNDDDLEAELRALQEEDNSPIHRKAAGNNKDAKGNLKSISDLDKMIALSMRDIPDDDTDDVSDTEDPELLAELEGLNSGSDEEVSHKSPLSSGKVSGAGSSNGTTLASLQERTDNYQQALASAKVGGDSSKIRRLERGLQTLEGLMKQAKGGKPIKEDEIPPAVAVPKSSVASNASVTNQQQSALTSVLAPASLPPPTTASVPPVPSRQAPTAPVGIQSHPPAAAQTGPVPAPRGSVAPIVKPRSVVPPMVMQETSSSKSLPASVAPQQSAINVAKAAANAPSVPLVTGPASAALDNNDAQHQMLAMRREQYKEAAMKAKRAGDDAAAVKFFRTAKQFDAVIQALDEGKPVDLSKMPPPPPMEREAPSKLTAQVSPMVRDSVQGSAVKAAIAVSEEPLPDLTQEDRTKLFKAPEKAGSVMEALQQRLGKYKEAETQAKQEDATSKMKRMGRIVKQYEDAIKLYKAGKPVDFDELPCPPGFPPIPVESGGSKPPSGGVAPGSSARAAQSASSLQAQDNTAGAGVPPKVSPKPSLSKQVSVHSRAEQQAAFLAERQLQFKQAAMAAKASGDVELAKKYLRMAKGFDQMIEASKSGLPVDLSQIPPPPGTGSEDGFVVVNAADVAGCSGDRDVEYKRLQEELVQQTKMCENNRDHFTKLGDVSSATKFDKMCQSTRKDLDALKNAFEHGDPVPRFHYENRQFSLVQSCTDLGDNDLEICVVRGLNYNLPSGYAATDMNTYVKYEFPFPAETPQQGTTDVVKGTNCPEYNQTFKLEVNRKSRSFLRLLKGSKGCKLEVFYRRGFMKGDKSLGTINIKLQPLEDKCIYHDSYDLVEGRKAVGGKLEVKMRVRDPYVNKQVEEVKEKWLVIDHFERKIVPQATPERRAPAPGKSSSSGTSHANAGLSTSSSISVLRYEKQMLDQRITQLKDRLKPAELESLQSRGRALDRQAEEISERLRRGGAAANKAYVENMTHLLASYIEEAKSLGRQGNTEKLQITLTKRKLVEKEIEKLSSRMPVS